MYIRTEMTKMTSVIIYLYLVCFRTCGETTDIIIFIYFIIFILLYIYYRDENDENLLQFPLDACPVNLNDDARSDGHVQGIIRLVLI